MLVFSRNPSVSRCHYFSGSLSLPLWRRQHGVIMYNTPEDETVEMFDDLVETLSEAREKKTTVAGTGVTP